MAVSVCSASRGAGSWGAVSAVRAPASSPRSCCWRYPTTTARCSTTRRTSPSRSAWSGRSTTWCGSSRCCRGRNGRSSSSSASPPAWPSGVRVGGLLIFCYPGLLLFCFVLWRGSRARPRRYPRRRLLHPVARPRAGDHRGLSGMLLLFCRGRRGADRPVALAPLLLARDLPVPDPVRRPLLSGERSALGLPAHLYRPGAARTRPCARRSLRR